MDFNSLNIKGAVQAGVLQKAYENTLSSAATSVILSGLDGDVDLNYRLIARVVANNSSSGYFCLRFNSDSGNNYNDQYLDGSTTTVTASRNASVANNYLTPTVTPNNYISMPDLS